MEEKRYELRILPLFEEKLQETADYIAFRLRNPIAAEDFVDAVEAAILERLKAPEAFEPYRSKKDRKLCYPGQELSRVLCGNRTCDGSANACLWQT